MATALHLQPVPRTQQCRSQHSCIKISARQQVFQTVFLNNTPESEKIIYPKCIWTQHSPKSLPDTSRHLSKCTVREGGGGGVVILKCKFAFAVMTHAPKAFYMQAIYVIYCILIYWHNIIYWHIYIYIPMMCTCPVRPVLSLYS